MSPNVRQQGDCPLSRVGGIYQSENLWENLQGH